MNESASLNIFSGNGSEQGNIRYHVLEFRWHEVSIPLIAIFYVLLVSVARTVLRLSERISTILPECCLMIVLGVVIGLILLNFGVEKECYSLSASVFFLYLLPPIIFDAGCTIANRTFFENIGAITLFAVIGTIWNAIAIGISLWCISLTGLFSDNYPFLHLMLFAALISATDPVAVLTVFEEMHVNKLLFTVVFGESLFNDAIALVLYRVFQSFAEIGADHLIVADFIVGGISFLFIAVGSVIIGVLWAVVCCLLTKITIHGKVQAVVYVFTLAYCAYLTAEMLGFSAIITTAFYGIVANSYVKLNVTTQTVATFKLLGKALSSTSESVTFLLIGMSVVSRWQSLDFNGYFVTLTIVFCLVYRTIGVFCLSFVVNKFRMIPFSTSDQLILSYGGLRGPIAFGLAVSLPDFIADPVKEIFITCCIALIFFNVFIQGLTMIPLLNCLKVERDCERKRDMIEYIGDQVNDYTSTGIEAICGFRGYNSHKQRFEIINQRFLKPLLIRRPSSNKNNHCGKDEKIFRAFCRLSMIRARDAIKGSNNKATHPSPGGCMKFQNPAFITVQEHESKNL